MEHLKCRAIGWALALSSNIRIGWRGLPGTTPNHENERKYLIDNYVMFVEGDFPRIFLKTNN